MAGETILVIDDSAAVQDVTTRVLEEDGYRVSAASNGVAALAYPDIASVDLAIVDSDMDGFDGPDTIKALRAAHETFHLPVLLLVPESRREQRASQSLHGAQGYLLKPFEAGALKRKVATLLEERKIDQQARLYLQTAADRVMEAIAQEHVQAAIEKRTQIIAERMIQNLVALVDQHARREVEAKVTSLSAEKEQELVRLTVNEVAQSMVEKLAERKVADAMQKILAEQTDKTVRRTAEATLPALIRERLRESLNVALPREIQAQVSRAAEAMVPDLSNKILQTIESVAQQSVPKIARERVPEVAERLIRATIDEKVPKLVTELVAKELDRLARAQLSPMIDRARATLESRVKLTSWLLGTLAAALTLLNGYLAWLHFFPSK